MLLAGPFPPPSFPFPAMNQTIPARAFAILIAHLLLIAACGSLVAAEKPQPIAPVLQSLVEKQIVPGAVALVADKDKVLALETSGFASLATKESMREDCVFWIASMSKSLTGTALMMLVDEGKVSLDDPVEKYLPEFKEQEVEEEGIERHPPAHPITVREIMTHTSGLVLASDPTLKRTQSLAENVAAYAARSLRREPGTKYEYNNCGINTGGRIIEVVSGQPYAEFMQTRLFAPLGMKDTTFWPNAGQAKRLAHSARLNAGKTGLEEVQLDASVTPAVIAKLSEGADVPAAMIGEMGIGIASSYAKHYGEPAGGFFSTGRDIGVFCQMLLNGGALRGKRYLSEKAVQTMSSIQTGDVPVNPEEAYGIGWSVKIRDTEGPSVGSYGHRGARRACMWIDPKNGLAMVLLVARFDMKGEEQKVMYGSFMKAAVAAYGKAAR